MHRDEPSVTLLPPPPVLEEHEEVESAVLLITVVEEEESTVLPFVEEAIVKEGLTILPLVEGQVSLFATVEGVSTTLPLIIDLLLEKRISRSTASNRSLILLVTLVAGCLWSRCRCI